MNLKNTKTIFLDYDGTLHNSMDIYKPAFLNAFEWLVKENHMEDKNWTDEEISQFLGQSPKEMWDGFGHGLSQSIKSGGSQRIGQTMQKLLEQKKASLFDGAIDTLQYLKNKGYTLVFISNCTNQYMNKHKETFNLDHYFDAFFNAEMFDYLPKEDILSQVKDQFKEPMVIIGDRLHDIKAGKDNDIYTIGCAYGFGTKEEMEQADLVIDDIKELKTIF
ncbi:MAG: HAD family hydrolase [Candidatus Izemoplasmatales bacterium]